MQNIFFTTPWDFELLDSGGGFRLERWGKYTMKRPDPQAIWKISLPDLWENIDAEFDKEWINKNIPQDFNIKWQDVLFKAKLSPFKHTGIFAEGAAHWEAFQNLPKKRLKILNLFAYTGCSSIALTKLGHFVTHVDASKPSILHAKENQKLNNLDEQSIRWIIDDVIDFVKREVKRGGKYDAIIMDPPAFGHAPDGKQWKFNQDFPKLLAMIPEVLSDNKNFVLINAYATNISAIAIKNLCEDYLPKGTLSYGDLCLKQKTGRLLSTGIYARINYGDHQTT